MIAKKQTKIQNPVEDYKKTKPVSAYAATSGDDGTTKPNPVKDQKP